MDKTDLKVLLQACRLGGRDWEDPVFRAALEQVASDPELAEWFRQEQEFDAVMVKRFGEVPVDTDVRDRILREVKSAISGAADRE